MKFDENLAAVHSYLCADGYVIKNPPTQKVKYYKMGLRNTNIVLLKDFQDRFYNYFGIKPHLYLGQRCQLGSKEIYYKLTNQFGSFYSKEWSMPELNKNLVRVWLRTFFDCEGWVFCKIHQNRHIGIDSINERGLNQVKKELENLGIKVIKKELRNRYMFRLFIYGKDNLKKFRDQIGFLHPDKREKLDLSISDFMNYFWNIEDNRTSIQKIMLQKAKIKSSHTLRVISKEKENLDILKSRLSSIFDIDLDSIKLNERTNGLGTRYFELSINRKVEIEKLIKHNLINKEQLGKIK